MSKNIMAEETCESFQSLSLWLSLGYSESFKSQKILGFGWNWISKVQLLWIVVMEKTPSTFFQSFFWKNVDIWSLSCWKFSWEMCTWPSKELCWIFPTHPGTEIPTVLPEAALLLHGGLHVQPRFLSFSWTQISLKSVHFIAYVIADVYNLIGFLCVS